MTQQERKDNTKKALGLALRNRLTRCSLEELSVTDISEDCKLNRKTFYNHFRDIYDLFSWCVHEDISSSIVNGLQAEDPAGLFEKLAITLKETPYLSKCLKTPIGNGQMKAVISEEIYSSIRLYIRKLESELQKEIAEDYREFLVIVYSTAIAEAFVEYVRGKIQLSSGKFSSYVVQSFGAAIKASILAEL